MAKLRKDGSLRISNQEFKKAINGIVEGREPRSEQERLISARIMASAAAVIMRRRGIMETNVEFNPDRAALVDLIETANARQRKVLHDAAQALKSHHN